MLGLLSVRMQHPGTTENQRGFTLIELLAVVGILAVIVTGALFFTASYIQWAKQVSDQRTLLVLNDAINRYKCEGGNVNALTAGAPISHVLANLKTAVTWAGMSHQFLQNGFTCAAKSLFSAGTGAQYRFGAYNTYKAETGCVSTGTPVRIYLTTVGAGTWTLPSDWNSGTNTIECIGEEAEGEPQVEMHLA